MTSTAERSRAYRERKRLGVVGVVRVPVYVRDVETLVEHGRLALEDQQDREKIREAVEDLVDDFTEGKIGATRHA